MITDYKVLLKLALIEKRYQPFRYEKIAEIPMQMWETREHFRNEPDVPADQWRAISPGEYWGGSWITAWMRGDVTLPDSCSGKCVFVNARTGHKEAMFIVDGEHRGVFDPNHCFRMLTGSGEAGRSYHVTLEAYSGHTYPGGQPDGGGPTIHDRSCHFEGIDLCLHREDVTAFIIDLRVLRQLVDNLDQHSLRRGKIIRCLRQVYEAIEAMPAERDEDLWRPKLAQAREIMRPLLECTNGSTMPWYGIIGHSHMDTAWLWPISETWRKCARTYSSILNLMEQYPEFMFVQSSPCHTEKMRELYPEIFDRIQQKVAEGRWEPNGAMWVEPDCNLTSGEGFVRQLLVGQTATREMFGYTADTLWLPDVFGYSAALPQILRQADVEFFCTTKISWNDMTTFPYETFVWKGLDGSSVITHFSKVECRTDPDTLIKQWKTVQHPDVQDRMVASFGPGDGGGGPLMEEIECARRLSDLEGCPKVRYMTVSDFMQSVRDDLGDELPHYSGELYLELHRGTLTSVAGVKRGNRKAELALREAEFLCTLASLQGRDYPAAEFLPIWKEVLTNQFHDILPGSSIAEVNIEAVKSFDRCIAETNALADAALTSIAPAVDNPPASVAGKRPVAVIANSLSWDREGEMLLAGIPEGLYPDGAVAQRIEPIDGEAKLAVAGLSVPALGMTEVALTDATPAFDSPFTVSDAEIDTPHVIARFDDAGRMISLFDKASGREVCSAGGSLNRFMVGEDVPWKYDNWDIDRDQYTKMAEDFRLVSREVVADGPLQLRIRSVYNIASASTLTQDMVFHSSSAQVDFETTVDWHEKHTLLRAAFDIDVLADRARHEIQFGYAERPTHTNRPEDQAMFEVCNHKWTDISDAGFGVALLNDCKYGVTTNQGSLGLSLIKSGTHPDYRGDEGMHVFSYAILPHAGGFSVESVVCPGYEFNIPVDVAVTAAGVELPAALCTVSASNVIVEAVKWAEDGAGFIVRLYEAGNMVSPCTVNFGVPVKSVSECNLLEENREQLELDGGAVSFTMRPFQIRTLYCAV